MATIGIFLTKIVFTVNRADYNGKAILVKFKSIQSCTFGVYCQPGLGFTTGQNYSIRMTMALN
ncbi:hypothetical protein DVQ78_21605 [Yersinia enterocolitica]|nr:hypothetical protein [Yersinia enterocolitica]